MESTRGGTGVLLRVTGLATVRTSIEAILLCLLAAVFFAWYGELFREALVYERVGFFDGLLDTTFSARLVMRMAFLFVVGLASCLLVLRHGRRPLRTAFDHRYGLAVVVVVGWTALSLSTSSIANLASYLPGEESGLLFGIARMIRSDEWMVTTPLTFSQQANDFATTSPILMGANVMLGYNLPTWSVISLFRPFQWGYLLLGVERGLSLYTVSLYVASFLTSLELALLITREDRWLSVLFAIIITFSPFSVWWGPSQFVIIGQLLVLFLHRFLRMQTLRAKMVHAGLIAWLCGCYLFLMYPAWMVPYFYVFALMGACVVASYVRDVRASACECDVRVLRMGMVALALSLAVVVLLAALSFRMGWSSVEATLHTVYPGGRLSTGGAGDPLRSFLYGPGVLFAITFGSMFGNASEMAAVFGLFPCGLMLTVWLALRRKAPDPLCILLAVLELAFLSFFLFGWPLLLARVTLMTNVTNERIIGPTGYIDAVMLVRTLALLHNLPQRRLPADSVARRIPPLALPVMVGVVSCVMLVLFRGASGIYLRIALLIPLAMATVGIAGPLVGFLLCGERSQLRLLSAFMGGMLCLTGLCVNPIQCGAGVLAHSELGQSVSEVLERPEAHDGINDHWMAIGPLAIPNICTSMGAPMVNSTNVVPRVDLWRRVDPDGESKDVYNRYCHVMMTLVDTPTRFELVQTDFMAVQLSYADMKKLGIGYVVCDAVLTDRPELGVSFESVGEGNLYSIYRVTYS